MSFCWTRAAGAVLSLVVTVTSGVLVKAASEAYWRPRASTFEDGLPAAAVAANKGLPRLVDSVTRFDRVEAGPGNAVTYRYTVMLPVNQIDLTALRQTVLQNSCASADLKTFRDHGTALRYDYQDQNGGGFFSITVTRNQCGT